MDMKMKKSKLIISIIFIILIVVEICIGTYILHRDYMNETENLGKALTNMLAPVMGTLILIPELEIWHVILHFVSDKKYKKVNKTVINSIEGILAIGILFFNFDSIFYFLPIKISENIFWIWLIIYAVVKFIHLFVWGANLSTIENES